MWLLVVREPLPDAPYWPGRRVLAALDAAGWPILCVLLIRHAPQPVGLLGPVLTAVALLYGLGRLHRALWENHRYRFTTWRWGRMAAVLLLVGVVVKALLTASVEPLTASSPSNVASRLAFDRVSRRAGMAGNATRCAR